MPTFDPVSGKFLAIGQKPDGSFLSWDEFCRLSEQKSERELVSDEINRGQFELPASPEQE